MELNLPKVSSGTEGYHLKCYKNFSAIMVVLIDDSLMNEDTEANCDQ